MALREQGVVRLCVICSAVLAASAFLFPFYCAEIVFIFLVPLFYMLMSHNFRLTFKNGFLWGTFFYTLFFFDIYLLLIYQGEGVVRFFAVIVLLVYGASVTGCWFVLAEWLRSYITPKNNGGLIICWGFATYLFSLFITRSFFFIFDPWEGNSLHHFALPLAIRSQWLLYIGLVGLDQFFLFIMSINIFISNALVNKRYASIIGCILFLIICFCFSNLLQKNEIILPWFRHIGFITISKVSHDHICAAEQIMHALETFQIKFPHCRYLIMPESTFAFPLNSLKKYISLWDCPSKMLFLGAHRSEKDSVYNTLYKIHEGAIVDYYDKNHRMFFTEKIPAAWAYIPGATTLFLLDKVPFEQGNHKKIFTIPTIGDVRPLICSDLFFTSADLELNQVYLCSINDSWFYHPYIPNLMLLHAQVVALAKKSSIIYCGYRHSTIITEQGNCLQVPTFIA